MGRRGSLPKTISRGAAHGALSWLLAMIVACTRAPAAQPGAEQARLELLTADADLWAFEFAARATLHARARAEACTFSVGPNSTPAQLQGNSAQALLSLNEGDNLVAAHCLLPGGRSLHSDPVRLRVRLRDGPVAHAHVQLEEG